MLYRLAQIFFRIYFVLYHRIRIVGMGDLEKFLASLPPGSPVILAANHESYLDPPAIGMAFPRRLRFIAWEGLFRVPVFAALIRALGAVPVSQENKNSAAGLLREVIGFIKEGFSVLIFPEGERTPDGTLQPLEGGVALISSRTGAPIVPIWIEGTWEAYPIHYLFPRPRRVTLTFGAPIFPGSLPDDMPEKDRRRSLLESLETALERMRDSA
ncbi:MAG: 1-acyl-sn-glycerol-3-phosphate acyltransferase [Synergistaceae bacterium]|jgi:1-acyl-sn-glycerol-3-phosphate acyltransferase|nr:1-acyl-sn-glycerol-3-phosphate acyltransferase [Synergistaceae bacterium]